MQHNKMISLQIICNISIVFKKLLKNKNIDQNVLIIILFY